MHRRTKRTQVFTCVFWGEMVQKGLCEELVPSVIQGTVAAARDRVGVEGREGGGVG